MGIYHTTINLNFGEREREEEVKAREEVKSWWEYFWEREEEVKKLVGIFWERERERGGGGEKAREEVKKWEYFWERERGGGEKVGIFWERGGGGGEKVGIFWERERERRPSVCRVGYLPVAMMPWCFIFHTTKSTRYTHTLHTHTQCDRNTTRKDYSVLDFHKRCHLATYLSSSVWTTHQNICPSSSFLSFSSSSSSFLLTSGPVVVLMAVVAAAVEKET